MAVAPDNQHQNQAMAHLALLIQAVAQEEVGSVVLVQGPMVVRVL